VYEAEGHDQTYFDCNLSPFYFKTQYDNDMGLIDLFPRFSYLKNASSCVDDLTYIASSRKETAQGNSRIPEEHLKILIVHYHISCLVGLLAKLLVLLVWKHGLVI
jgi:hypothetical protein